jgi:hypothetical protein
MKEEQDYKILDQESWCYLYDLYGGVDIPRYSITVPTATEKDDYIVETNLRKFCVATLPKVRFADAITNPIDFYVSREDYVHELHYAFC